MLRFLIAVIRGLVSYIRLLVLVGVGQAFAHCSQSEPVVDLGTQTSPVSVGSCLGRSPIRNRNRIHSLKDCGLS